MSKKTDIFDSIDRENLKANKAVDKRQFELAKARGTVLKKGKQPDVKPPKININIK